MPVNVLITIVNIAQTIVIGGLYLYSFLWLGWIIMSWLEAFGVVHPDPYHPVIRVVRAATDGVIDKVFGNIRDKLIIGFIDLSPFIFLFIVANILPQILSWLFAVLRQFIMRSAGGVPL
ncbi:MAG: YggT family protein [Spirochaetes bacterium]|nr:YggT family protein [Spirochaetota bacterium]